MRKRTVMTLIIANIFSLHIFAQIKLPPLDTRYGNSTALVLQIQQDHHQITVNGKQEPVFMSTLFFSRYPDPGYIHCPFIYGQYCFDWSKGHLLTDAGNPMQVPVYKTLNKILFTTISNNTESIFKVPDFVETRLLLYLKLDIAHNLISYLQFDCYAFVCFLKNLQMNYFQPELKYVSRTPKPGEIIALAANEHLPDAITHWAIYLGNNLYLSKFGESQVPNNSLVYVSTLSTIMKLYNAQKWYVAIPTERAKPWDHYRPRNPALITKL